MSGVIILTPVVIASWPVITAAVTAAVASMGFSVVTTPVQSEAKESTRTRAEIDVEDSEILQDTGTIGGELVIEREGIRAIFSRDARGALKVCIEGEGQSKSELKRIGQELIDRVTQQYVYHRVVTELQERNMAIVDEQVNADRSVRIRVRSL